jgi:ABC-type polysaccharide/polyol phosphate transport system ATPase subunit
LKYFVKLTKQLCHEHMIQLSSNSCTMNTWYNYPQTVVPWTHDTTILKQLCHEHMIQLSSNSCAMNTWYNYPQTVVSWTHDTTILKQLCHEHMIQLSSNSCKTVDHHCLIEEIEIDKNQIWKSHSFIFWKK